MLKQWIHELETLLASHNYDTKFSELERKLSLFGHHAVNTTTKLNQKLFDPKTETIEEGCLIKIYGLGGVERVKLQKSQLKTLS